LDRLIFYDKDSKPITGVPDESKKRRYLREIKADYIFFKASYNRADFKIYINNINLNDIPDLINIELNRNIKIATCQHTV